MLARPGFGVRWRRRGRGFPKAFEHHLTTVCRVVLCSREDKARRGVRVRVRVRAERVLELTAPGQIGVVCLVGGQVNEIVISELRQKLERDKGNMKKSATVGTAK